ncbi:helix-turn-helix domain-containing protein [Virgibacillus sp. W0181]|uniref:helix-turn-helix domain-containing protein n=1 Tax=Virgibacillus sp. W0181 TaxID=3391581 RepID=UPI003F46F1E2
MNSFRSNNNGQSQIISGLIQKRKELGLTQRDLAERANLHQTAIARLEKEGAIPRLDTLEKVAHALELQLTLVNRE